MNGNNQQQSAEIFDNSIEDRFLTVVELSETLKVKQSTLRDWVFKRQIPVVRIGRLVRFRWSEVEKWLHQGGSHGN